MKKVILFFFPFLILMHIAAYWVVGSFSTVGDTPALMMIRVEQNGRPFSGSVTFYDDSQYAAGYAGDMTFACFIYRPPRNLTRLEIYDPSSKERITIPAEDIARNGNVSINADTGEITGKVTFGQYFTGIFSTMLGFWPILMVLTGPFAYYFFFLTPIAFIVMIYVIVREKIAGQKRGFSGSFLRLIFGFAVIAYILYSYFFRSEEGTIDRVQTAAPFIMPVFWFFVITGYGLYFLACRSFDPAYYRAKMKSRSRAFASEATTVKKYTVTTWSDGSKTDDYAAQQAAGAFWAIVLNIVKLIVMPLVTYHCLIKFYLMPLVRGEASWMLHAQWLAEQENTVTPQEHAAAISSTCAGCGTERSDEDAFCIGCGAKLTETVIH